MPKVLVLFDSDDQRANQIAESAADGAKSVRFTEVDIRVVGNDTAANSTRRRRLESVDAFDEYDGVIVVGSDQEVSAAIRSLLAAARPATGEFVDRVFAAIPNSSSTTHLLSEIGGILVGSGSGVIEVETAARQIGARVARVAEWVRHALSHEAGHGNSGHAHSHHHHSH